VPTYDPEGRNERGRVATLTSFSIFDSYEMKSLNLVMISSVASKRQVVLKVGMPVFQPFYEIKDL
jgi:hypothetical protein